MSATATATMQQGAATMPDGDSDAQPKSPNAARDHLANERTLLAWLRTSLAIVALGFVVARFGILLRELAKRAPQHASVGLSTVLGTGLVLCGAIITALAAMSYVRTGQEIERNDYRWTPRLAVALGAMIVVVAVLLAIYLLVSG